ncbi:MAG: hypothetical protein AB8H86_34285 [Polyangiales bacterium]
MSVRADLLALDADKLAALANRGLVKRAMKALAKGELPTLRIEGDVVFATDGDVVTELRPGVPLADCPCTCPATKICRHRVTAVVAYQEFAGAEAESSETADSAFVDWSPGTFEDEVLRKRLGTRTYKRAERQRTKGYVTTIRRPSSVDDVPTASLSTCSVRFLVPSDLAYARCDCTATTDCEHVALAVWAFRKGDEAPAPEQSISITPKRELDEDRFDAARQLLDLVLLDGVESGGESLRTAFAQARQQLAGGGMIWPADVLEEIEELVARYDEWDDSFGIDQVSTLFTELHARLLAAESKDAPVSALLGVGQAPETEIGQGRMVGLGARVAARGTRLSAEVFFADPRSTATLAWRKEWARLAEEVDPYGKTSVTERRSKYVASRRVLDVPLSKLARSQVIAERSKRRANGALLFTRSRIARASVLPQAGNWGEVLSEPLLVRELQAEQQRRESLSPRMLRSRILNEAFRVVAIGEILDITERPSIGAMHALATDEVGEEFIIEIVQRSETPHAYGAAQAALSGDVRFVSGVLERGASGYVLRPASIATAEGIVVPDFDTAVASDVEVPSRDGSATEGPLRYLLARARRELDHAALRGLRRSSAAALRETQALMSTQGLKASAERLGRFTARLDAYAASQDEAGLSRAWLDASVRIDLALEHL